MPRDHAAQMQYQRERRAAKRAAILYKHPRCVVCNDPIVMKPGRNHRARTCGKRECAYTRANWLRDWRT